MRLTYLLFYFFVFNAVSAQEVCKNFSIHEVYEMTKALDFSRTETLTYKNYSSFNFKEFKPVDAPVDNSNYIKVWFNKKNEIREILYYKKDSLTNRMVVFNFEDRRILTLGNLEREQQHFYWPVAIIMDRRTNFNYLINTSGVTKHQYGGRIWIEEFERMSSVMILDENLMPTDLFRIKNGHVVLYSEIKCEGSLVADEYVHLYSLQDDHDLKIDFNTCPETLKRNCRDETPDLSFHTRPSAEKSKHRSIWIHLLADNER